MRPDFHRFPSVAEAAEACAAAVLRRLSEAVSGDRNASFAISGGSSPVPMFQALARSGFDWSRVHLFWVDERAVPPSHADSNYGLAEKHFLLPAAFPDGNVHRIMAELGPKEAARRYEQELRDSFSLDSGGVPSFDVIHRGIGADAHTASLFPGEPLILADQGLAAAVWVEKLKTHRITLLPAVLRAARYTVVLAGGGDKAEAFKDILEDPYNPLRLPAQIGIRDGLAMEWFLDVSATRLLA